MYSRVYVEVTNICNLNCPFCHKTARAKGQMTFEQFANVLQQLQGVTKYVYFHVMGEPLTHPLLPTFVQYARSQGFLPAITTNGTLLPAVGEQLLNSNLYKVSISLHCTEGGKEQYLNDCLDFADRASAKGVLVALRLWNGQGKDGKDNAKVLQALQRRFAGCEFASDARGVRIRDKLHLEYDNRFVWPDENAQDMGNRVFCYGLRDHFGILVDGSVVPCCLDADGAVTLGNVFQDDLQTVLSSPRAMAIKQGFDNKKAVEKLCQRCGYARRFKV